MTGFGVGWMLGEGIFFTDDMLWKINIFMWGIDMPFFLIACNGEAGCWKPEHLTTPDEGPSSADQSKSPAGLSKTDSKPSTPKAVVDRRDREDYDTGLLEEILSEGDGSIESEESWAIVRMVTDFTSSFKCPAYRWYWIWLAVNAFSGMIETSFMFFWLQDCFPDGYYFFQFEIASNVKSAVALQGVS